MVTKRARLLAMLAIAIICVGLAGTTMVAAQDATPTIGGEEPTAESPTVEPTAPPEPTISPTVAPEVTATETAIVQPEPELAYSLDPLPTCTIADGQSNAVAAGGSVEYFCRDHVSLTGTSITPALVSLIWTIDSAVNAGWQIQILPPANPGETSEWSPIGSGSAQFVFEPVAPLGVYTTASTLDTIYAIEFGIRVFRPACGSDEPTLEIRHALSVMTPEAIANSAPSQADTLSVVPSLLPIPVPSAEFAGPLTFGEVVVTAAGPDASVKSGILSVTVSNLNLACGEWLLHVSGTPLTDSSGERMSGSTIVVVGIEGSPLSGGGCALSDGCDLQVLTGSPEQAETLTIEIEVELRMDEAVYPGAFSTSLTVTLIPYVRV